MLVEIACTVFPLIEKKFLLPANDYRTSVQEELNLALLILVSMLLSFCVHVS
jgi:membrane protein DedA with SNARE-associated domain